LITWVGQFYFGDNVDKWIKFKLALTLFLETTNGLPMHDKKNLNEWLTSFNRSQRFNRSRAALSLGSTSS
ncbi:hypothetical protein, partial [Vibrio sp. DNB22_19_2]